MAARKHRRHSTRRIKRVLFAPFHAVVNAWISIKEAIDAVLHVVGLKGGVRRRYNRDFERAGREAPNHGSVDSKAASNLKQADRVRDQEIIQRVIYENRTIHKKNKEGEELRRVMLEDNLSFSQGQAISHLAKMNQRAKKKDENGKPEPESKPPTETEED